MIKIENLQKNYAGFSLNIKDLVLEDPGIVVLFGNNGAGKTSLMRCCLDMVNFSGAVYFGDEKAGSPKLKQKTAAYLGEENLIDFFTVQEYFEFIQKAWEVPGPIARERLELAAPFLGKLAQDARLIRDLSSGNRRKVGLTGQFIPQSSFIFLDEPFNDLDPSSQVQLQHTLSAFLQRYKPLIFLSSHAVDNSMELADRVLLLEEGQLRLNEAVTKENRQGLTENIKSYFAQALADSV